VRTGVLVDDGTAYFGASLLPWKKSYLCAVDARDGSSEKRGCFVRELQDQTLEGPLACTDKLLVAPQGRVAPDIFARADGRPLGALPGGGGSLVVVTGEQVWHGPGNKQGWITSSNPRTRTQIARYQYGNAMVFHQGRIVILTDQTLSATDTDRQPLWSVPCDCPLSLLAVGDALVAGGVDQVAAFSLQDGRRLWQADVDGRAFGLAYAGGRLLVSTDTGVLHGFEILEDARLSAGRGRSNAGDPGDALRAAPATEAATREPTGPDGLASDHLSLKAGPWLRFLAAGRASVRWRTEQALPSVVVLRAADGATERVEDKRPKRRHELHLTGLARNRRYTYWIEQPGRDGPRRTVDYACETFFNYSLPLVPATPRSDDSGGGARQAEAAEDVARRLLAESHVSQGLAIVIGSDIGPLAAELARQSELRIVGLVPDGDRLRQERRQLFENGQYGGRIVLRGVTSRSRLPLTSRCANLVVAFANRFGVESDLSREVSRLLVPGGVGLVIGNDGDSAGTGEADPAAGFSSPIALRLTGLPIEGAGQWTHIYGGADNAAYGGESLGDVRRADQLDVQWIGRPGPRYQADRNGRKPPPLAAGGRLFLQGLQRILCLDQYNGSILWSLEVPHMGRFNMPRDTGNWCADGEYLYVEVAGKCWQIDARRGRVAGVFAPPAAGADHDGERRGDNHRDHWGYVARHGDWLFGTAVPPRASWSGFWGKTGWYDEPVGEVTDKVCSDRLFAIDPRTGKTVWQYEDGAVINSTITIGGQAVFFVESRHPAAKASTSGRLSGPALWQDQYLVALDARTGERLWQSPINTVDGKVAFSMAYGAGQLVLVSSADLKYHVYAFDAQVGSSRWQTALDWGKGRADHGSHLSRPAIAGDRLFVRPAVIDMASGTILPQRIPVGGCGTYACTDKALLFRGGSGQDFSLWDMQGECFTQWNRLRPDCWLSSIPAGGLLLAPEGGGGCSCGKWMESSMAFIPRRQFPSWLNDNAN
jgi:outer membrane protein assembly factor BamB